MGLLDRIATAIVRAELKYTAELETRSAVKAEERGDFALARTHRAGQLEMYRRLANLDRERSG